MDALLICLEEIALEGLDGCPIVHLWKNLEKLEIPFPLKLDDSVKNYLWTGIVEALDVSFYLLDQPLPRIFSSIEDKSLQKFLDLCKKLDLDELNIDVTMSYYKLVNDGKIRGSCPEYDTRKDVTSEIRSETGQCVVSLKDAQKRWGDRLVMVASQEMRTKVLFPEDADPNVVLSDIEYCILEHVGQARSKGRLQRCININFKIDSRTTFHFLKKMSKIGLVTKQRFVTHNTLSTNICSNIIKLKRFHTLHHHKYDVLAHQLCQKLLEQPDHTMAMKDLREFFEEGGTKERIFKKIRQDLQTSGHLQVVMKRVPSQAKTNRTRPTKGNLRHYVKLLKPFNLPNDNQDDKVDDDGEEEDDDDDDNVPLCDGNPNVVIEFSLLKQMYNFIESQAEHGIPNMDIDKALKISHYERRALVRTLEKSGHIEPVLTYGGRQSFLRYVATPYVGASTHLNRFLEEEKKLDAMKTVAFAGTSTSTETPSQTPLDSPCPSPSQSIKSTENTDLDVKEVVITGEKKPKTKKSTLAGKVTYRTLKRNNYIIDYLKEQKVVKGFHPILKAIQEAEEKEGLETKMDRVCLKKLLAKLLDDGLIKRMATVININDTSHNVELYLDISVSPQDSVVQVAVDQCRFQFYGEANKSKASSRKRVKRETDTDEHKVEDENEEDDINPDKIIADHSLRYKYGYLAKFPRMRLFHEYLWQLLFGIKETNQDRPSVVKSEPQSSGSVDSGSENPQSKTSEVRSSSGEFDSKTHDYGWINYLEPFPLYGMPLGWFKLSDAISIMPLSVFCNIMGIVTEVDCLDQYYSDPNLKHKLIKDLPDKMQRLLKYKGRYKQSLCNIVSNLMCAGLLTPKQPLPNERLMTEIHFNRGAIVVDTSPSLPNFNYTQEPPGHKFSSKKFSFNVFSNVQTYWDEVMCVALNTPLGIRRAHRIPKDKKWFKFKYCEAPVMLEDSIEPPPGDGKGACGLDTYLYAHICKNWSFSGIPTKFELAMQELKSVSVKDIEPPKKKAKKTEKEPPKKTKPKKADMDNQPKPKSKSKRPTFEDMIIRPPKKPKGAGPPTRAPCFPDKKSQKQTLNASNHLISVDDVDREAITKTVGLRKIFSADSDKILILCRIGLEIMKKTSYRNPYPFQDVRNIVHEYCEDAFDKTAPNCQKRLSLLMKNPKNVTTINVCVAEYSSNQEFLGLDNPELPFSETFYTLVTRLIELSRTRVASLEDTSQLSSTLDELYERFYVQRLDLPGKVLSPSSDISVLGPPIQTVKDIRVAVARDVIQIACHSEQAKYNHLGVFKLFDELNMEEKEEAFIELQKAGLIIRRKDLASLTNLRRTLPFAPISVQLSHVYNQHFKPKGTQPVTFDEAIQFLRQFNKSSGEPSQQVRPTPIKLTEENVSGGDVACILSLLTVNKVTVECHIPDEMLQTDEKQQDNFSSKTKSKPSSVFSKQKIIAKKGDVSEGKVGNKPKPNIKKARKTVKRKSESEKPDKAEEDKSERGAESSEDGTKNTHTNDKRELRNEEAGSEGGSKPGRTNKLPEVRTTETGETIASEIIQDSHGEDNSKNIPMQKRNSTEDKNSTENDTDTISSTVHEFVRPKTTLKKKENKKENPKQEEVEVQHQKGTKEVIQENGATDDKEKQTATNKGKEKEWKRKTNEKARNTKVGTEEKEDTEDEALEDPFVNNDSLTHCKFSTPVDLSPTDHKLFTPVLCSDTFSTRSFDIEKTAIVKTVRRVGRMKGKGITAPTLLTKSSEIALVNNCSLFIRPKATSNSKDSVGDIDIPMDTKGSNQSLDILSPRSLDVILKNLPSLDAYLDGNDRFNASDRQLCTLILEAANEMKETGTSMELLKQMLQEKKVVQEQACYSLEQHLSRLCDNNLLLQVGNFERRYVCPSFARNWCIDFMKIKMTMSEKVVKDTSLKSGDSQLATSSTGSDSSANASVTEVPGTGMTEVETETASSIEVTPSEVVTTQPTGELGASVGTPSTTVQAATEAVFEQPVASAGTPSTTVQAATEAVFEQPVASAGTPSTTVQAATEAVSEQPVASVAQPSTIVQATEAMFEQPVASVAQPSTIVQSVTTGAVTTKLGESPMATTSATMQADEKKENMTGADGSSKIDPHTLTRSTEESEAILCRPWLEINGKLNQVFLKSIISAVLSDIMNNPGISEVHLTEKYVSIIRPVYFTELLEYLLSIGCITKHTLSERKPSSLFSSPTVKQESEKIIYYLPVVDCIVTLANAIKSLS